MIDNLKLTVQGA